ncbi:hypothetical protein MMC08_007580 [Hypocenomyce scalaris]|nr:hypothetical protein [Hypocenomyce scalaris]
MPEPLAVAAAAAAFQQYILQEPTNSHFVQVNNPSGPVSAKPAKHAAISGQRFVWVAKSGLWWRTDGPAPAPLLCQDDIFQCILDEKRQLLRLDRPNGVRELWKKLHSEHGGITHVDVRKFSSLWIEHRLSYTTSGSSGSCARSGSSAGSGSSVDSGSSKVPSPPNCLAVTDASSQALETLLTDMENTVKSSGKRHLRTPIRNMEYWTTMMKTARLPLVYTTPDSVLGKGDATYEEADVLFLTEEEARLEMLEDPDLYWKPIVVCAVPKEGQDTIKTFLDHLNVWFEYVFVESQSTTLATEEWLITRVKQHFNTPWTDGSHLPINLLDLDSPERHVPIWLQDRRFNLLDDVYWHMREDARRDGGKAKRQKVFPAEMSLSTRFKLLAQRGAVSTPHQDHHGFSTWLSVVEGKMVWTIWAKGSEEDLEAFRSEPASFIGGDRFYVILEKGQTLIMRRPLTIHSPATLEDCLLDSGCYLQYNNIIMAMRATVFELRNPETTNEDPAQQLGPLLNVLKGWIGDSKKVTLFEGETELHCFNGLYDEIMGLLKSF